MTHWVLGWVIGVRPYSRFLVLRTNRVRGAAGSTSLRLPHASYRVLKGGGSRRG